MDGRRLRSMDDNTVRILLRDGRVVELNLPEDSVKKTNAPEVIMSVNIRPKKMNPKIVMKLFELGIDQRDIISISYGKKDQYGT